MIDPTADRQIREVVSLVERSRRLLFITGAGMSADSGLPTYRGIGGLYERGVTEEGVPIEVALSGEMLRRRPALCWKYIAQIEAACRGARHNRGHDIIAQAQNDRDVWVLTQNVDGFHHDAGSRSVIDIHGRVHDLLCTRCQRRHTVADYGDLAIPPVCAQCSSLIRPDVVLFGEMLPMNKLDRLRRAQAQGFDLVFTIGTTSVFPYIAEPVLAARRAGTPTVEINPGTSEVSEVVDVRLRMGAMQALDAIWSRVGAP